MPRAPSWPLAKPPNCACLRRRPQPQRQRPPHRRRRRQPAPPHPQPQHLPQRDLRLPRRRRPVLPRRILDGYFDGDDTVAPSRSFARPSSARSGHPERSGQPWRSRGSRDQRGTRGLHDRGARRPLGAGGPDSDAGRVPDRSARRRCLGRRPGCRRGRRTACALADNYRTGNRKRRDTNASAERYRNSLGRNNCTINGYAYADRHNDLDPHPSWRGYRDTRAAGHRNRYASTACHRNDDSRRRRNSLDRANRHRHSPHSADACGHDDACTVDLRDCHA